MSFLYKKGSLALIPSAAVKSILAILWHSNTTTVEGRPHSAHSSSVSSGGDCGCGGGDGCGESGGIFSVSLLLTEAMDGYRRERSIVTHHSSSKGVGD